jgi:hypothetical protein
MLKRQLWTGELLRNFRHIGSWLSTILAHDKYVNNDVINLADIGADPTVLIDNEVYPIASATREDTPIALALRKFETTNTIITDDEIYGLPYDKEGSVITQHREVLEESTAAYGLFALAPAQNSATTPVILTTGGDNGSGRKRLLVKDIATLKLKLDNLKVPKQGRVLVLCSDHVNDLLLDSDNSFRDRFINTESGVIKNFFGFDIYEDVYTPVYSDTNVKKAWGAAPAATDRNASVCFYAPRAFKATGSIKMYYARSEDDPDNRQSKVGFRLHHIVLPKKNEGFGAIVSDAVAATV